MDKCYENHFLKALKEDKPDLKTKDEYINKYMIDNSVSGLDSRVMFEKLFDAFMVTSSNI